MWASVCPTKCPCFGTRQLTSTSKAFVSGRSTAIVQACYNYKWPRPAVTVDTVIVAKPSSNSTARVLLIKRKLQPYQDKWALPGGFVHEHETLYTAAARELEEETSVRCSDVKLKEVGSFGDPGRDPRGWTITIAFAAVVPTTNLGVKAADDARDAQWYNVDDLPELAFDHKQIVKQAFVALASDSVTVEGGFVEVLEAAAAKLYPPWVSL